MADPRALSLPVRDAMPGTLLGVAELAAVAESVSVARRFVRERLGNGHPALDDVTLVVSELVSNAVRHSDSRSGGSVAVALADAFDRIHVDVVDAGSADVPQVRVVGGQEADEDEALLVNGRGLWLVAEHSLAWGVYDDDAGRTVWCQVGYQRASEMADVAGRGENAVRRTARQAVRTVSASAELERRRQAGHSLIGRWGLDEDGLNQAAGSLGVPPVGGEVGS